MCVGVSVGVGVGVVRCGVVWVWVWVWVWVCVWAWVCAKLTLIWESAVLFLWFLLYRSKVLQATQDKKFEPAGVGFVCTKNRSSASIHRCSESLCGLALVPPKGSLKIGI
jgi:hypothetical protein